MNYEILDALSQITREKSVDRALLVETLEAGLASAVRKKHGATADVTGELVVVPEAAVQPSQNGNAVYVVKADNTVEFRQVELKRTFFLNFNRLIGGFK